jgi:hypothetical protein
MFMDISRALRSVKGNDLNMGVLNTFTYFDYFQYPLRAEEVHHYMPYRISKRGLEALLTELVTKGELTHDPQSDLYALGGHGMLFRKRALRQALTKSKLTSVQFYLKALYALPYIELIGLSGSCAMENAKEGDDIDLFIISAPGRMWLSRLTAVLLAKILGIHRGRRARNIRGRVCLNLFFDRRDLCVPEHKMNIYVAHEVAQMKPLYIRGRVYQDFMTANSWIKKSFPNIRWVATSESSYQYNPGVLSAFCEALSKAFQLSIMAPRTREILSDTQLWFFPDDFEVKLRTKEII